MACLHSQFTEANFILSYKTMLNRQERKKMKSVWLLVMEWLCMSTDSLETLGPINQIANCYIGVQVLCP